MSGEYAVVRPGSTDMVVPRLDSNWPTAAVLYTRYYQFFSTHPAPVHKRVRTTHVRSEVKSTVPYKFKGTAVPIRILLFLRMCVSVCNGNSGPEDWGSKDLQLLRATEMQQQAKPHSYILAWSMQDTLVKIGRHFQHRLLHQLDFSTSEYDHVPHSPAPPFVQSGAVRLTHTTQGSKKHFTFVYSTALWTLIPL